MSLNTEPSLFSMKAPWFKASAVPAMNLVLWHLGIIMNGCGGLMDRVGSQLCGATYWVAIILVAITLVSAIVQWLRRRSWTCYIAPAVAILSLRIMEIELTWAERD